MEHCDACPYADAEKGCPFWVKPQAGFIETNVVSGEERFIEGCFMQVVPKLLIHVVKASNRPAEAMESLRNELMGGMAQVASIAMRGPRPPKMIDVTPDG